jgi:phage gpG-like protein
MAGIMGLAEAAARMAAAAADIEAAKRAALEAACVTIETKAKNYIGVPHSWWPPLAAETLRRKDGVNTPLLEQGNMRDSIEHTVVDNNHAWVGSNDPVAEYQELGTSRGIPPRSFLAHAAQDSGEEIAKMTARIVGGAIGAGLAGSRVTEFFELARLAGHEVKELGEDLVTPDEEQK